MNKADQAKLDPIRARRATLPKGTWDVLSDAADEFVAYAADDIDVLFAEIERLATSCGICRGPGPLEPAHPYCHLCAQGVSSYSIARDRRLLEAVELLRDLPKSYSAVESAALEFIESHDAADKETEEHLAFAEAYWRLATKAEVDRLKAELDSVLEREIESADEQSAQRAELVKRAEAAEAEVARLNGRLHELHQAMVKITRETPYPGENDEIRQHRAALIAEVGTLRSRVESAEATVRDAAVSIERLRRVVKHLSNGACIMDAPDGPTCFCGLPSVFESGECQEHGR